MPIHDVRHRHRDLGRIRAGDFDDGHPTAGTTWRLTSPHRDLLEAASRIYGGTVDVFDRKDTDDRWQLTTTVDHLDVFIPPQDIRDGQWYELWTAAGLARRCDGEHLVDGAPAHLEDAPRDSVGLSCICDPDRRQCRATTHLHVILPNLPDVGVWRLTTRSIYAAAELPPQVELLLRGRDYAPAVLALEPRSTGKGKDTRRFVVPVLRTAATLLELANGDTPTPAALNAPSVPEIPPSVPEVSPPAENVPSAPPERPEERLSGDSPPPLPNPVLSLAIHLDDRPRDIFGKPNLIEWISDAFDLADRANIWPTEDRTNPHEITPLAHHPIDEWAARYLRPDPLDPNAIDYAATTFADRAELVDETTLRAFATRVWMALRPEVDQRKRGRRP